jgi:hypothetical protein
MFGLPHTYRKVSVDTGTIITMNILTEIGEDWQIIKTETNSPLTKRDVAPSI